MGGVVAKYAFFPPDPPTYDENLSGLFFIEDRVPAVIKRPEGQKGPGQLIVMYTHGNAEDIGYLQDWLQLFSNEMKVDVISYDYCGYGLNNVTGVPSREGCYRDIASVWKYLREEQKYPASNIILLGRSIGSGPTCQWASQLFKNAKKKKKNDDTPGAVILQSPIASCVKVVSNFLSHIVDMFVNVKKIHEITCPILIIHGDSDLVVPYEHSTELWAHCSQSPGSNHKKIVGAGHNDIEDNLEFRKQFLEETNKLFEFLRQRDKSADSEPVQIAL